MIYLIFCWFSLMHLDFMLTYVEFMFDLCWFYVDSMSILCLFYVHWVYCWTKHDSNPCWKCMETKLNGIWNLNWLLFFFSFAPLSCLSLPFSNIFYFNPNEGALDKRCPEKSLFLDVYPMLILGWIILILCCFYVDFMLFLCWFMFISLHLKWRVLVCVSFGGSSGIRRLGWFMLILYWFQIDFTFILCWFYAVIHI